MERKYRGHGPCQGRCATSLKHHCINDRNPDPDNCRICRSEQEAQAAEKQLKLTLATAS